MVKLLRDALRNHLAIEQFSHLLFIHYRFNRI